MVKDVNKGCEHKVYYTYSQTKVFHAHLLNDRIGSLWIVINHDNAVFIHFLFGFFFFFLVRIDFFFPFWLIWILLQRRPLRSFLSFDPRIKCLFTSYWCKPRWAESTRKHCDRYWLFFFLSRLLMSTL